MTKRDKRLARMRRNPKNVRPDDLDAALVAVGFSVRQQGTSHRVYTYGSYQVIVPQRHPFLLQDYVKDALDILENIAKEVAENADEGDTEAEGKDGNEH